MDSVIKGSRVDQSAYQIKKRQPKKIQQARNSLYITRKTCIQSTAKRIEDLLINNEDEVFVHGLGASLNRALVLALELEKMFNGAIVYSVTTSTVKVTDDLFPLSDEMEMGMRSRPLSAVHIHIMKAYSQ